MCYGNLNFHCLENCCFLQSINSTENDCRFRAIKTLWNIKIFKTIEVQLTTEEHWTLSNFKQTFESLKANLKSLVSPIQCNKSRIMLTKQTGFWWYRISISRDGRSKTKKKGSRDQTRDTLRESHENNLDQQNMRQISCQSIILIHQKWNGFVRK